MQVPREDFLNRLLQLEAGRSNNETIQQSSRIVFKDGWAMTFNEEIGCRIPVPVTFTAAVAAEPLLALLPKLPDPEIDVRIEGNELKIRGKRRRAGIYMEAQITLPVDDWERELPRRSAWKPIPEEFSEAVGLVQSCGSHDPELPVLQHVHLKPRWIEACDNIQFARYRIKTGIEREAFVLQDSIRKIVALNVTEMAESETWLHFRDVQRNDEGRITRKGVIFSCRRYNEEYPQLDPVLNIVGAEAQLPRGLAEAVEKADVFASKNADVTHITVELSGDRVTIRGEGPLGWYEENKKVKYAGPPLAFTIAPEILSQVVRSSTKCILTNTRLKVDGGKWQYVTSLGIPRQNGQAQRPSRRRRSDARHDQASRE
jgi:hypothetical protein